MLESSNNLKWLQVGIIFITLVSVSLVRSHYLLRKNVLRKEKEERHAAEILRKEELDSIDSLKEQIDKLNNELFAKEVEIEDLAKDQSILHDLFERRIIDEHGNIL